MCKVGDVKLGFKITVHKIRLLSRQKVKHYTG